MLLTTGASRVEAVGMKLLLAIAIAAALTIQGCTTTTDANGTTTSQIDSGALQVAEQIAAAAAQAAISTYLAPQPGKLTAERPTLKTPAIQAAMNVTEQNIAQKEPSLPKATIRKVVRREFSKRASGG